MFQYARAAALAELVRTAVKLWCRHRHLDPSVISRRRSQFGRHVGFWTAEKLDAVFRAFLISLESRSIFLSFKKVKWKLAT